MLVTRHLDTEPSHWSFSKFETTPHKASTPPRMSNHVDAPSSTQPDWQRQYSYLPTGSNIFSQSYAGHESADASQPRSTGSVPGQVKVDAKDKANSPTDSRHSSSEPHDGQRTKQSSSAQSHCQQEDLCTVKPADSAPEGRLTSTDTTGLSMASNPLSSASSASQGPEPSPALVKDDAAIIKEDEDDVLDDEDMEGEGDLGTQPRTAAERTAQRRKMKRFRLTHQQTRFLMSEFSKQPHPDAAHRERLSREIPGLSPRQVQVWFQNRRAKIKRLTSDDRDRMIKMRAVPDDFDNVQALHSPYGAVHGSPVHGLGAPVPSPVDFGNSAYADHMVRPLMVDVRRNEADDHMSSTGLSPAFGNVSFNPSANMSSPDNMNPMSPDSSDHRYGYGTHMSGSMGQNPRPTSTFGRQTSLDSSILQNRQHVRPLQPLHLRETLSRSRSETLQSPLRSGMSWKGDSIDYTTCSGGNSSPQMSGRQQSVYQPDQLSSASSAGGLGYDSGTSSTSQPPCSASTLSPNALTDVVTCQSVQSPSNINYSSYGPSNMQQSSQSRLRSRAASATLPLGLDLRNQYRPMSSTLESPTGHGPSTPRDASSAASQFPSISGPNYNTSFPSAPLTAPMEFSIPRTPGSGTAARGRSGGNGGGGGGMQDYVMPQMSAPIAPPHDFAQAFQSSNARTPMRDSFVTATGGHDGHDLRAGSGGGGGGGDAFGGDFASALSRKRSFTMPEGAPSSHPGTHS